MLTPKKTKFRKRQKGRLKGKAINGNYIAFGDMGLKVLGHAKITSQQIEAARVAMMRHIKRGGKVWIRVFPDQPYTEKPAEVRQGKGKGSPVGFHAPVRPGKIIYEIRHHDPVLAREALIRASHKLPVKTQIVYREGLEL
jgi:large subunit ribosomal protein L16